MLGLRRFSVVSLVLGLGISTHPRPARAESGTAVLIMSTDRQREWTKQARKLIRKANLPCPYEIFFGNADTPGQVSELQTYIRNLEDEGASTVVVIPLITSVFSPAYRQWKYLLGTDAQPGFGNLPFFKVKSSSSVRFTEPFSDSAAVVEILLDRAQEISTERAQESVVIIAQGPGDRTDDERYRQTLSQIAVRLKQRGGYKAVEGFALQDEGSTTVRQNRMQALRDRIEALNKTGSRVIMVPMLLEAGGLEHRLGLELRGLSYVLNTKPLFPDSRIADWVRSQVP